MLNGDRRSDVGHGDCMGASSGAAGARRNVKMADDLGNHWDAAVRVLIEREARVVERDIHYELEPQTVRLTKKWPLQNAINTVENYVDGALRSTSPIS